MVTTAKYKIAPLKCWQKGKELRLEAYRDLATGTSRESFWSWAALQLLTGCWLGWAISFSWLANHMGPA